MSRAKPTETAAALPGRWQVAHFPRVTTTQTTARGRVAWSAVVAEEQLAGRGQFERTFTSDPGGLYLTAVVPFSGDAADWRGFALAVGWALREALGGGLRLRWPNDLLIGLRKVGGILVEQDARDTLLVGVGLNVSNRPWEMDPTLRDNAGSLAACGHAAAAWPRPHLVETVLGALRLAHVGFARSGLRSLVAELNRGWEEPRRVELDLAPPVGGVRRGWFLGLDLAGDLRLRDETGGEATVPAHWVARLREV